MNKDYIYTIDEFMRDIEIGLEMEFTFNSKQYTLSRTNKKYIFSAVEEEIYAEYNSYDELVESVSIGAFSIIDIVEQQLYEDWYIY